MPYKDRSAGLIVFGILTILLGCLAGLLVLLMLVGQAASARTTGAPATLSTILPAVFIYGVLAVALVWLGIGFHHGPTLGKGVVAHLFLELAHHGSVVSWFSWCS